MRFSLIMATVGRTEEVRVFLDSLSSQTFRDFELIVVDQNPDDRLAPILAPYEKESPVLRLRSEKGLSRARNVGLEHAGGEILAFPDDDCAYLPDTLERVDRFFTDNPGVSGITGRSVDEKCNTTGGRFSRESGEVNRFNVWARGISFTIFVRAADVEGLRFVQTLGVGAGTAWGSGEETDYLLKLLERGGKVYYDPGLMVVHPPAFPTYDAKARRKAYAYNCGMGHLLRRHGFPWRVRLARLARPLGGTALSAGSLRFGKAGCYWSGFRGRLRGMIS